MFLLLLAFRLDLIAQVADAGSQKLLHGSIVTAEGHPVAEATVELMDLRGIKVASSVTDSAGAFEISGAATPGEYVFLVARALQVRDERVVLDQPDLEVTLALPPASAGSSSRPEGYTVSATRLAVPAKVRAHLAAAHKEFSKMSFDKAGREIDDALRADGTCAQAFSMRAFLKLAEKDPNGAAEDAKHAALLDPDDAESFIALAMSYNSLGEFQKAEEAERHALSLRPDSWQGRLELAKSYYGEGKLILALRELDSHTVDFPDAHLVRGNVLMRLDRCQEAVAEFSAFLRELPNDPRGQQIRRILAMRCRSDLAANPSHR